MAGAQKANGGTGSPQGCMPYRKPRRTWAGHGSGVICDLCRRPIEADQIEYEVELPPDACRHQLNLHLSCYEEWSTTALEQV